LFTWTTANGDSLTIPSISSCLLTRLVSYAHPHILPSRSHLHFFFYPVWAWPRFTIPLQIDIPDIHAINTHSKHIIYTSCTCTIRSLSAVFFYLPVPRPPSSCVLCSVFRRLFSCFLALIHSQTCVPFDYPLHSTKQYGSSLTTFETHPSCTFGTGNVRERMSTVYI